MNAPIHADALGSGLPLTGNTSTTPASKDRVLKVAILASANSTSIARRLMSRLEAEGHDTVGVQFNESWRIEPRARIDTMLAGASHFSAP